MASNMRTQAPLCGLLSRSEVMQPWRVEVGWAKAHRSAAQLGLTLICAFAHAVRPRYRPRGQSRARPALYLVGCGRRLCPPYSAGVDHKKISGPHVTQWDTSRHGFREWPLTKEMIMTPRLNTFAAAPAPMKSWLDWSTSILKSGLEDSLMERVKIRASQINGCAVCLHMHTAAARKHGETEERLYLLDAWRESPLYSERERAALGWTEALTLVSETHAPDDVYRALQAQFAETIGREPASCRQLASRARTHVRAARPRFHMPKERGLEIAAAFFAASRSGNMQELQSLLAADVTVYSDGGGKRPASGRPIVGFDDVMRFHASLARLFAQKMSRIVRYGFINGLPGFVTIEPDDTLQTTALQIDDGKIVAIYVMRNPDKLQHLGGHGLH